MTTTTPVQQVQALIADVDSENPIFTDDQIQLYLDLNGASVRLAAADALDAIAISELMISKVIKTQDLQTDAASLAAELRARAAVLRQQDDAAATADAFGIGDVNTDFTGRPGAPELCAQPVVWGL